MAEYSTEQELPADCDERLRQLMLINPVVHQCYHMYRYGGLTWEQMLTEAVVALAEQNGKLGAELDRLYYRMRPQAIFVKDGG